MNVELQSNMMNSATPLRDHFPVRRRPKTGGWGYPSGGFRRRGGREGEEWWRLPPWMFSRFSSLSFRKPLFSGGFRRGPPGGKGGTR
jgi:hypothetical protein